MNNDLEREVRELIHRALAEDIGAGDITSQACVPAEAEGRGRLVARQDLTLAGIELLPLIYDHELTPGPPPERRVAFTPLRLNGERLGAGEMIATVAGPVRRLLERERVALNFLQRLCGTATRARQFVEAVSGAGVTILDTRKTTPGMRILEKRAVAAGGAANHRMGLYDAVLIKENHVAAAGGIRQAIEAARRASNNIEVEVRDGEELREAIEAGAQRVLLDNMTPDQVRACVELVRQRADPRAPRVWVEVSGGISLDNVRAYALAGPDFISVGALTHSAPAADISFLLESVTSGE